MKRRDFLRNMMVMGIGLALAPELAAKQVADRVNSGQLIIQVWLKMQLHVGPPAGLAIKSIIFLDICFGFIAISLAACSPMAGV